MDRRRTASLVGLHDQTSSRRCLSRRRQGARGGDRAKGLLTPGNEVVRCHFGLCHRPVGKISQWLGKFSALPAVTDLAVPAGLMAFAAIRLCGPGLDGVAVVRKLHTHRVVLARCVIRRACVRFNRVNGCRLTSSVSGRSGATGPGLRNRSLDEHQSLRLSQSAQLFVEHTGVLSSHITVIQGVDAMAPFTHRSDPEIFLDARTALDERPSVPAGVRVHVDHGTVTLTGSVQLAAGKVRGGGRGTRGRGRSANREQYHRRARGESGRLRSAG